MANFQLQKDYEKGIKVFNSSGSLPHKHPTLKEQQAKAERIHRLNLETLARVNGNPHTEGKV